MARQVLTVQDATVSFGDAPATNDPADVDPSTLTAYTCQFTDAAVEASANTQTIPATFCDAEASVALPSSFAVRLGGLQDWGDAASFSKWAFDNDATLAGFAIEGVGAGGVLVGMKGICSVVAGDFMGAAGGPLTWDQTFPCPVKPIYYTPVAGLEAPAEAVAV
jgi:hypothetical protein